MADAVHLVLFALFISVLAVAGAVGGRLFLHQYRTPSGRAYAELLADHHAEERRRGHLVLAWAEARGRRIARLDHRQAG